MSVIWQLTLRNTKMFLRDKVSVFFSFLSVIIIISLYALFLGDMQVKGIVQLVGDIDGIRFMVDSWIMAGLITANSITVSLAILGTMIEDIETKALDDFMSSPVKRYQVVMAYILSAWIVGITLTMFTFIIAEFYIVINGGEILSFVNILKTIGVIMMSVISFSSISFFVISFIKSRTALGTLNTVVGTLIGFLTGIYIPIGVLGEGVQTVIKMFPPTYSAIILRNIFMKEPLSIVFKGAPVEAVNEYKFIYGVSVKVFNEVPSFTLMALYIVLAGVIFYSLSIFKISRMKRK